MTDTVNDPHHQIALFRYGLISSLLHLPAKSAELQQRFNDLSSRQHTIPGTTRTRVAPGTLRDWLRRYRAGGFDALLPKARDDRGRPRGLPPEVADQLLSIKEANPKLSVRLIIEQWRCHTNNLACEQDIPASTVHRLFTRHGLMAAKRDQPTERDRRRFAFKHPGQLWTSDVMYGPSVTVSGKQKRKTYLIAFLDDATRVVPYAAFALAQNTRTFLPVFKQAILRRGLTERLYVDNGANYRSHHLALVCAKLGIALIHSRPFQPQGRGKIERWFKTVRAQLLTRLSADDTAHIDALNRRLWAWVEGEYHRTPHRGLDGQTPLDRWAQLGEYVRYADPSLDLDELFLFETTRKVQSDRTVSLNGVLFEVDAVLVGERITLRFDPATPSAPVQVMHNGRFIEQARRVDLYANCFVKRHHHSANLNPDRAPDPPPAPLAMRALKDTPKD